MIAHIKSTYITITGHDDASYNGVYYRSDSWGGKAHFANEAYDRHLYYFASGETAHWYLDHRIQQHGTVEAHHAGGFMSAHSETGIFDRFEAEGLISHWSWSVSTTITLTVTYTRPDPVVIHFSFDEEHYITIAEHSEAVYNGIFYRSDDWAGQAHYAKRDYSAHLYYSARGSAWLLDDRGQAGDYESMHAWARGGELAAANPADLDEDFAAKGGDLWAEWSSGPLHMTLTRPRGGQFEMYEYSLDPYHYIDFTGHPDAQYNGRYMATEPWNGLPHYCKEDYSAHFYYYSSGADGDAGYWCLDNRPQDGSDFFHDGGSMAASSPYDLEAILGGAPDQELWGWSTGAGLRATYTANALYEQTVVTTEVTTTYVTETQYAEME